MTNLNPKAATVELIDESGGDDTGLVIGHRYVVINGQSVHTSAQRPINVAISGDDFTEVTVTLIAGRLTVRGIDPEDIRPGEIEIPDAEPALDLEWFDRLKTTAGHVLSALDDHPIGDPALSTSAQALAKLIGWPAPGAP